MFSALRAITTRAIQSELRRRDRIIRGLQRQRAAIAAKLATLDRAIADSGGAPAAASRRTRGADGRARRRRNKQSLVESLAAVLKGKTMSVKDTANAVRRAGYRTASRHFYTQVNIALIKSGKFRRVSRGKYQVKPNG